MSQLDRHLTTEQLSALLDDQPGASEQYREHLASCQQCQQELAELRQTVNLLHALPPPALPRSFVLSTGITQIAPESIRAQSEPNIHILRSTNSPVQHNRPRRSTGRRVLSLAGTLAAVVGILFVLSGFLPTITQMRMSASSVSEGASSNSSTASSASGSANSEGSAATGQKSSMPAIAQPRSIQASQTPDPTPTQDVASTQPAPTQDAAQPPPTSFFDWGATGLRIGLGILLFIAGMMGIALGRERSKKAKA